MSGNENNNYLTTNETKYLTTRCDYYETQEAYIERIIKENFIRRYEINKSEFLDHGPIITKAKWIEKNITVVLKAVSRVSEFIKEYADLGNLRYYLNKNTINWEQKINIARQVTSGLYFLHKNEILHRDLHSKNVVIKKNGDGFKAIITNFGLSKALSRNSQSNQSLTERISFLYTDCWNGNPNLRPEIEQVYKSIHQEEMISGEKWKDSSQSYVIFLIPILVKQSSMRKDENISNNTTAIYSEVKNAPKKLDLEIFRIKKNLTIRYNGKLDVVTYSGEPLVYAVVNNNSDKPRSFWDKLRDRYPEFSSTKENPINDIFETDICLLFPIAEVTYDGPINKSFMRLYEDNVAELIAYEEIVPIFTFLEKVKHIYNSNAFINRLVPGISSKHQEIALKDWIDDIPLRNLPTWINKFPFRHGMIINQFGISIAKNQALTFTQIPIVSKRNNYYLKLIQPETRMEEILLRNNITHKLSSQLREILKKQMNISIQALPEKKFVATSQEDIDKIFEHTKNLNLSYLLTPNGQITKFLLAGIKTFDIDDNSTEAFIRIDFDYSVLDSSSYDVFGVILDNEDSTAKNIRGWNIIWMVIGKPFLVGAFSTNYRETKNIFHKALVDLTACYDNNYMIYIHLPFTLAKNSIIATLNIDQTRPSRFDLNICAVYPREEMTFKVDYREKKLESGVSSDTYRRLCTTNFGYWTIAISEHNNSQLAIKHIIKRRLPDLIQNYGVDIPFGSWKTLYHYLKNNGALLENQAKNIFKQIIEYASPEMISGLNYNPEIL
ncbi:17584_t:CDS:10 [Gigaspora rosea]|nr:17584_t:CDS:10 [Gigaspora rosea]